MKWLHISRYTDDQCTGHSLLGNIYISHHFHNSTKYLLGKGVKVPLRYSKIQCFFFFFKENCSFNLSKAVAGREERNRRHLIFCVLVEMMRNDRLSLRHLIWPELRKILRQQYPDYNFFLKLQIIMFIQIICEINETGLPSIWLVTCLLVQGTK